MHQFSDVDCESPRRFVAWKLSAQLKLGGKASKLTLEAMTPGHSHSHLGPLRSA